MPVAELAGTARSTIRLALDGLCGDHMVLQRRQPLVVGGTASPGAMVDVGLGRAVTRVQAGDDGCWRASLPAQEAGGPYRLHVASGRQRIELDDVMIGEVWLCSGQSNMDWKLADTRDGGSALATADRYPGIRLLTMPRAIPGDGRPAGAPLWRTGSQASAARFSATAYHFGLRLHRELGVAVGLIDASWGGTRVHAWMPAEALAGFPGWEERLRRHEDEIARAEELRAEHRAELADWAPPIDSGRDPATADWHLDSCEDAAWSEVDLPCWWQRGGHDASGVLWFRRDVDVPAANAGREAMLRLGACDKADETWVNGVHIGGIGIEVTDGWRTPRVYHVPAGILRPGRNVIAVRAFSNLNQGGLTGPATAMRLEAGGWSQPLSGRWRWRVERDLGRVTPPPAPWTPGSSDAPGALWHALIEPATSLRLAGVIWYQGESDEYEPVAYRHLFPAMIRAWRRAWGRIFPFVFVQLPGFGSRVPRTTLWAELREAQAAALDEPATAMVPCIDIGDPDDLHPHNKAEVGRRLALAALATAYGRDEPGLLAPVFDLALREGGVVRIALRHGAAGLRLHGGRLRGFEVAGEDRRFVDAEAQVDGEGIQAWSPQVPVPCWVRYAWADMPEADACTPAGLPLAPFGARPVT